MRFFLLLLFEQFAFTADVAAITLGGYIFSDGADIFTGQDFCTDGSLYHDLELLAGNSSLVFRRVCGQNPAHVRDE